MLLERDSLLAASTAHEPARMLVALVRAFDEVPTAKVAGDPA